MINYFVSAENIAYHHWQLELLIESFKNLNLQDSLTIALAENSEPVYVDYSRNLSAHKKVFTHENAGRKNNCLPYNRIFSLYTALLNDQIRQPVVILHPDTVLIKPFDFENYDIVFQMDSSFKPTMDGFVNSVKTAKGLKEDIWFALGDTLVLNNAPLNFIRRVLEIATFLAKGEHQNAEKLAWALAMLEYYGHLSFHGTFEIENILLDDSLKYVIHYKHGLPPVFDKRMFRFEPPNVLGLGDPYNILLENNPTKVTDFLQKIVEKCKKRINLTNKLDFNIPVVNII